MSPRPASRARLNSLHRCVIGQVAVPLRTLSTLCGYGVGQVFFPAQSDPRRTQMGHLLKGAFAVDAGFPAERDGAAYRTRTCGPIITKTFQR